MRPRRPTSKRASLGWQKPSASWSERLPLAIGLLGLACAARAPAATVPADGAGCAELYQAGLTAEGLGFSLAWLADDVPRDLDALAAWVGRHATLPPIQLEPPADADLAGLTGPTACPGLEPARLLLEGPPPRVRSLRSPAAAAEKESAARSHLAARRFPEARADWHAAAALGLSPLPAPGLAVAASYTEEERWQEALSIFRELAERYPWNPEAHAGVGRSLRALAQRVDAVEAWGRALALRPRSPELRSLVGSDAFAEVHPPLRPPAARLEQSSQPTGVGQWAQLPGPDRDPRNPQTAAEAGAYAACKEAFRSSPALRRAATGRELPTWLWTPAEESVCAGLWLRVYLQNRGQGRAAEVGLDELVEIAREGFLDERALHDLGAWVHPAAPLLLEEPRRRRLFTFVEKYRVSPRRDAGWLFP
jgi:tetratricopeptide (TPR) repeat protein